jgi:hypothetical protein
LTRPRSACPSTGTPKRFKDKLDSYTEAINQVVDDYAALLPMLTALVRMLLNYFDD